MDDHHFCYIIKFAKKTKKTSTWKYEFNWIFGTFKLREIENPLMYFQLVHIIVIIYQSYNGKNMFMTWKSNNLKHICQIPFLSYKVLSNLYSKSCKHNRGLYGFIMKISNVLNFF